MQIWQASLAARQLIHALLHRDPASRLGSNTGANEIKQHPFFRDINWPLIRCMVILVYLYMNCVPFAVLTDISLIKIHELSYQKL